MGFLGRLFSRDEADIALRDFDSSALRADIDALIDALNQLADAMDHDDAPLENPGWRGRMRDLRNASGSLRLLIRRPQFDKDELYEILTTVRPLYRGEPPRDFAHLAEFNTEVVARIEAVHRSAN